MAYILMNLSALGSNNFFKKNIHVSSSHLEVNSHFLIHNTQICTFDRKKGYLQIHLNIISQLDLRCVDGVSNPS